MSNIEHKKVENLFWFVHDECYSWLTGHREHKVSIDQKIDRLIMAIGDLATALAGGYREDGERQ